MKLKGVTCKSFPWNKAGDFRTQMLCLNMKLNDVRAHCYCEFFAHVTHTSCIADHEDKRDAKGANIFHKNGTWNACGVVGQLWTQIFSEMSRNGLTVRIDNRSENFAAILLSWILGDPHFSFLRSLPFLILSILTKNKKKNLYVRS